MQARNLIAATASVLILGATLSVFALDAGRSQPYSHAQGVSVIDGLPVTNLPGIVVYPTPAERRAAALLSEQDLAADSALMRLNGGNVRVGAELAMPYYSFGAKLGQISKD